MDASRILIVVIIVLAVLIVVLRDYRRRLRLRALQPTGSNGALEPVHKLAQLRGPQTARAAWKRLRGPIAKTDDQFRILHITSAAGIGADGCSSGWTFLLHLPTRRAVAVCEIAPVKQPKDPAHPELTLTIGYASARPQGYPHAITKDFIDSPAAAAALAELGIAFSPGVSGLQLEAVPGPAGGTWQAGADAMRQRTPCAVPTAAVDTH